MIESHQRGIHEYDQLRLDAAPHARGSLPQHEKHSHQFRVPQRIQAENQVLECTL
jgi:hypothetical protein